MKAVEIAVLLFLMDKLILIGEEEQLMNVNLLNGTGRDKHYLISRLMRIME